MFDPATAKRLREFIYSAGNLRDPAEVTRPSAAGCRPSMRCSKNAASTRRRLPRPRRMLPLRQGDNSSQDTDIPNWRPGGQLVGLCNCAIGCPCNFGSDPTLGYCEGVLTWADSRGQLRRAENQQGSRRRPHHPLGRQRFREEPRVRLSHRRPRQRCRARGLAENLHWYAGGAFAAWRDLTLRVDGVEFVKMNVTHNAKDRRASPGMVEGLGGPFRKYMVPDGDTCRIYNAPRPEVVPGFLTVGTAKRNVVTGALAANGTGRTARPSTSPSICAGPRPLTWRNPLRTQ